MPEGMPLIRIEPGRIELARIDLARIELARIDLAPADWQRGPMTDQKIADAKTAPTISKNKTTMTGAGILWECLEREGVKDVFGYPAGL
jgi:hypothetical protein